MSDSYFYPGTKVLKNKFELKDASLLDEIEFNIVSLRLKQLEDQPLKGEFNFKRLQETHKHLFGDIYEWAGEPRTINISKKEKILNGASVQYGEKSTIENEASKIIDDMNKTKWNEISDSEKAAVFTKQVAALWQVHAFREGNTRTTLTFAEDFAQEKGFPLDKETYITNPKILRDSLVFASIGESSEPKYLQKIIQTAIDRGKMQEVQEVSKTTTIKVVSEKSDAEINKQLNDLTKQKEDLTRPYQREAVDIYITEHWRQRLTDLEKEKKQLRQAITDYNAGKGYGFIDKYISDKYKKDGEKLQQEYDYLKDKEARMNRSIKQEKDELMSRMAERKDSATEIAKDPGLQKNMKHKIKKTRTQENKYDRGR